MTLNAFEVHKPWLIRAALVLVATVLADGIVVEFVRRPLLWATLIGCSLPFSMILFVAIPLLRDRDLTSKEEKVGPVS